MRWLGSAVAKVSAAAGLTLRWRNHQAVSALPWQVPQQWMKYLLPKGFVAVDGCSLTVRCAVLHVQAASSGCILSRTPPMFCGAEPTAATAGWCRWAR